MAWPKAWFFEQTGFFGDAIFLGDTFWIMAHIITHSDSFAVNITGEIRAPDGETGRRQVQFVDRAGCPCCLGNRSSSLWSGRFSDPEVAAFLKQFHYNADLDEELGDQAFDLVRCQDCGLTYHRRVLSEDWLPVVYSRWTDAGQVARFEAAHTSKIADRFGAGVQDVKLVLRLRLLVSHNSEAGPVRLLDFGCGDGKLLTAAQVLGMTAIGLDISESRAESARSSGCLVVPDFAAFDSRGGGKVHAVVLRQVLEHVLDPLEMLKDIAKRMLPDGVLFVAVPNCDGLTVPQDFGSFHKLQPIEHVNAFTPDSLRRLAAGAGFRPLRRPLAAVSTGVSDTLRSLGGLAFQPDSTDQFFRLA